MGKGKGGGNIKGGKRQPSYFDNKRQQLGDNFLSRMNPDQLRKDMPRIVKDIAYRNVDVMKDYMIFMDANFLAQLEQHCLEQRNNHIAYEMALSAYRQNSQVQNDPVYVDLHQRHTKMRCAYDKILSYIYSIRMTGDPNYLYPMMNDLFPIRFLF